MKNYKVKITRNFKDTEEDKQRVVGTETEEFMCTKERYEFLKSKKAVELVEVQTTIDDVIEEKKWAVTQENDGIHVRPVVNGEIIDTPIEKVVNEIVEESKPKVENKPKKKKNRK